MEHPLWNLAFWLRYLVAGAVLLWLPGHLLGGRFLSRGRFFDRLVLSLSVGLVLPIVFATTLGALGVPFAPLPYLGFVAGLAIVARLWAGFGQWARSWESLIPAGADARVLTGALLVGLALSVAGNGRYCAPPHVHDASNHAWITARVLEAKSLDPSVIEGEGPGFVDAHYAPGLHGPAALVAGLGGLPAYVSVWMQTILFLALSPLAWTILWRAWGFSRAATGLGVVLAVANPLVVGVLGWGGFGQVLGFFLVPALGVLLAAACRRGAWAAAVAAGLGLGAQALLHFSEVVVAPVAALLVRRDGSRPSGAMAAGIAVVAVAVAAPSLWPLLQAYGPIVERSASETKSFGDALERWSRAGGRDVLQALLVLGLGFGLARRATRPVALVCLGLGVWYVCLQTWADPVSSFLAAPFYRQAPRLLYLQFFVASPLMALPLIALHAWLRERWNGRVALGIVGVLLLAGIVPNLQRVYGVHTSLGATVPFDVDDVRHAEQIAAVVGEGEPVLNLWNDGSTWAMHVSGRRFVCPASWESRTRDGRRLRELLARLPESPWPPELAAWIEQSRISWLYVSDSVLGQGPAGIRRADLQDDSRFEPRLVGANSTLYRLRVDGLGLGPGRLGFGSPAHAR